MLLKQKEFTDGLLADIENKKQLKERMRKEEIEAKEI